MKTKGQIIKEFDQAIRNLKEWVEGKPVEELPEWINDLELKSSCYTWYTNIENIKSFIRTEVIEKICEEMVDEFPNVTVGEMDEPHIKRVANGVKSRWLGSNK